MAIVFVVTIAIALVPMLFLLAATPLHNGDDLPRPLTARSMAA